MAELRIGTCSWKYDSWQGLVYSDAPKINYLKEYSEHYKSVEIDQWFWSLHGEKKVSLPNPKIIEAYKMSVPDDFKFSVKLPNSISLTHFYNKSKTEPLKANPTGSSPGTYLLLFPFSPDNMKIKNISINTNNKTFLIIIYLLPLP